MARFIIHGGKPLRGTHTAPGNKNAALPMLAACVLTDQPVRLRNMPLIQDVITMMEILDDLGVDVDLKGRNVTLCAKGLHKRRLPPDLCRKVRSSILFAGPMAARHGSVTLYPPGGDVIGRRPLDTHFAALRSLGMSVKGNGSYAFRRGTLKGARILLDEASVTATESAVMAAVLAKGRTTLFNAACEPHVQDLCRMLNGMGAAISGIGTNLLAIDGVRALHGVTFTVPPDFIDVASFLAAGAVTGGAVSVDNARAEDLDVVARGFGKLGLRWSLKGARLSVGSKTKLRVRNDYGSAIPKIEDGPWPSFPSDLMSIAIVLATQAEGTLLFFEKMFESRMYFVDRLIEMGARIVQCDPHRVIVAGPSRLHGIHMSSPDIRAGISLVLAALCSRGRSVIENAQSIDRGYERVDEELRRLGADVTRVE